MTYKVNGKEVECGLANCRGEFCIGRCGVAPGFMPPGQAYGTPTPNTSYLAGPMRGFPLWNFPAFDEAAANMRSIGWKIISPAELDRAIGFDEHVTVLPPDFMQGAMRRDIEAMLSADSILLLPGWEKSSGTAIELTVAEALGLNVFFYVINPDGGWGWSDTDPVPPETALQEAQRLVHGNRGVAYGHPADDFTRTGRMWGAILGIPDVAPEHVGLCMAAVKISREVNMPKRDNRVDLAGYAETVEMVHVRREGNQ